MICMQYVKVEKRSVKGFGIVRIIYIHKGYEQSFVNVSPRHYKVS